MCRRRIILAWLGICVLLAGIRLATIAVHSPVLAYANNYDFLRSEACVGLWPHPRGNLYDIKADAPIRVYRFSDEYHPDVCTYSSDLVFAAGLRSISRQFLASSDGWFVDIRSLGLGKLLATTLLVAILFWFLYTLDLPLCLFASIMFLIVFADPVNALYLNTLYSEYTMVVFCFVAIYVTILIATQTTGLPALLYVLWVFTLLFLGTSKHQAVGLPILFTLFAMLLQSSLRRAILPMALGGVVFAASAFLWGNLNAKNDTARAMHMANQTDTYLQAVLPAASDRSRALEVLGLPSRCDKAIGLSWFSDDVNKNHPCPEIGNVSRLDLLQLFLIDPQTFFKPFTTAVPLTRPWLWRGVGHIEGQSAAASILTGGGLASLTWARLADGLPANAYSGIIGLIIVAGFLSTLFLVMRRRAPVSAMKSAAATTALSGLTCFYAIASSVFGDGYLDVAKHAILLQTNSLTALAALIWLGLAQFRAHALLQVNKDVTV